MTRSPCATACVLAACLAANTASAETGAGEARTARDRSGERARRGPFGAISYLDVARGVRDPGRAGAPLLREHTAQEMGWSKIRSSKRRFKVAGGDRIHIFDRRIGLVSSPRMGSQRVDAQLRSSSLPFGVLSAAGLVAPEEVRGEIGLKLALTDYELHPDARQQLKAELSIPRVDVLGERQIVSGTVSTWLDLVDGDKNIWRGSTRVGNSQLDIGMQLGADDRIVGLSLFETPAAESYSAGWEARFGSLD